MEPVIRRGVVLGLARAGFVALHLTVALLAMAAEPVEASSPVDVWLDVDTANGVGDVDDGLMVIQAFHSPEVKIRGLSVVFGNTTLEQAVPIARTIVERFGPLGLEIYPGAASAEALGEETAATRALAAALKERPLTILAVGPVTNIGSLLKLHPELAERIERIIMVAARRPGQRFVSSATQARPHRDFNFELDPSAMQVILDTQIPLVFAPWEVSSHVWIGREELAQLKRSGGSGAWIAETSEYWIAMWEANITPRGFNPFDTLALGWVTHPELIDTMPVTVRIEQAVDDRATPEQQAAGRQKPYLHVEPLASDAEESRSVIYCHTPKPEFTPLLLSRLAGRQP